MDFNDIYENHNVNNQLLNSLPSFVKGISAGKFIISIEFSNQILGTKMNLYKKVNSLGWLVPEYASKAVTVKYLNYLINGTVFRMNLLN